MSDFIGQADFGKVRLRQYKDGFIVRLLNGSTAVELTPEDAHEMAAWIKGENE